MLIYYPLSEIFVGFLYVGIIYLLARKERKPIFYSLVILASVLQIVFLSIWRGMIVFMNMSGSQEFPTIENFSTFVDISYYILSVPFLLIVLWFAGKIIWSQKHFPILRIIFLVFFVLALYGVFVIGPLFHMILYYGFAP